METSTYFMHRADMIERTDSVPFIQYFEGSQTLIDRTLLKDSGFKLKIVGDEDENSTLVTDQVPKPGVKLIENSTVYLYTSNNNTREVTSVPNFKGMNSSQVLNSSEASNISIVLDGSGTVVSQDIAAGTEIEVGSLVTVTLQSETVTGY